MTPNRKIYVHNSLSTEGSTLFVSDPRTGLLDAIGNTGQALTDIAITYQDEAYAVTANAFYRLNLATGGLTFVANLPGEINAMASDSEGRIFAMDGSTGRILLVNPTNGSTTNFAVTTSSSAGDLVVANNQLWLSTRALQLESYDLTTGAKTGAFFHGISNLKGLAIGNDAQLYGFADNKVYQIDIVAGRTTEVASFTPGTVINGAANTWEGVRNWVIGSTTGDNLSGSGRNDLIAGHGGDDTLNGSFGTDTARFTGPREAFTVTREGVNWRVTDTVGDGGSDLLISIENLLFDNQEISIRSLPDASTPGYGLNREFLFDEVYYLLANPDLPGVVAPEDAFEHYLNTGAAQGRDPNAWFDPVYYANRWADLRNLNLDAATLFQHYNLYGVWEGRSAGPAFNQFDGERYLAENGDVATYVREYIDDFLGSRTNGAIAHYVIYGANELRAAYETDGSLIDLGYVL